MAPHAPRAGAESEAVTDPWDRAARLRAAVTPPVFPLRDFPITDFGAIGDGEADCSDSLRRAVLACARAGGGHVIVPEGRFLTGPVRLISNVDLHLVEGATLAFSTDPQRYLPPVRTRFEGTELLGHSPLVSAFGQRSVAVSGAGTLDGQAGAEHWWPAKGLTEYGWRPELPHQQPDIDRLRALAEARVPVEQRVFGAGNQLRPSFIQPYQCRNVLIDGVTVVNSPMWVIHPVLCEQVMVRGVTVVSHGPNNDGCNPESCRDVVITGCVFDTGDDCIAVKSGRNADGRRMNVPSERILVEDCEFRAGHGGVTVGSEISAGVRDVYAQRLRMTSPALDVALRFKTNSMRGGYVHGFHARDITVGSVARAVIEVDLDYEEGQGHGYNPTIRAIDIRDLRVRHARRAVALRGYPDAPLRDVRLSAITVQTTDLPDVVEHVEGLVMRDVSHNGVRLPDAGAVTPGAGAPAAG